MAEIRNEPKFLHSLSVRNHPQEPATAAVSMAAAQKRKRLDSLDIFRGLTITIMILVDGAGVEWPAISHAQWDGVKLADFVMPFFLFIVGMAIPFALKRITDWRIAAKKVIFRTIKLLFWGIFLQGGYFHTPDNLTYGVDLKRIRWCGILQRIALAYLVVSMLEIITNRIAQRTSQPLGHFSLFKLYMYQWLVGLAIFVIHLCVVYGTYVPDWEFTVMDKSGSDYGKHFKVICGVRGNLEPSCNAIGHIDRTILGINHLYHHPAWRRLKTCTANAPYAGPILDNAPSWCHGPFDPEGIISSMSAILSTLIGAHFGHVLVHVKEHSRRLKHWSLMGVVLLLLGIILHFSKAIPINKFLYSFSYICVTSGPAALVFSAFYIVVDVYGVKYPFLPLKWIGLNAMLIYVMAAEKMFAGFVNGWYIGDPSNTLVYWIRNHVFINVWHSRRVGVLLYVIFVEILFWIGFAGVLHWKKIYWKL